MGRGPFGPRPICRWISEGDDFLLNTTVGALFHHTAALFPDRLCIETDLVSRTYAQTEEFTDRIALFLLKNGFQKGSRLGLWCKDSPEFLHLYLAMEKLGCIPVLLNTSLTGREMRALLIKSDAEALFYDDGFKGISFPDEVRALSLPRVYYIPELLHDLPAVDEAGITAVRKATLQVSPQDPDVIIFTSGTSGTAKGVLTNHFARVNVAKAQIDSISMTEQDKCLITIPLFHCFGLTGVALAALCCGASLFFPAERRTHYLLEAVSVHKCTILSAVPTLYSALIARPDIAEYDLSSLRTGYIGGSIYTPDFFHRVEKTLHLRLAPSLGQTEATAGLTFLPLDAPETQRACTVGRFLDTLEGQIRDIRDGHALPKGEIGELCIRGWSVMQGYVNEPELTKKVLEEDGWLHTGDLGWMDDDDCIHLSGRLKELIIRGGENISPGEIEGVIASDARVREVKAVAVPDPHYGEEVCVCIALREGIEKPDPEEFRNLAGQNLAAYKIPRYILYLDSLPKTGSGKLALAALQKQAAEMLHLNV